MFNYIYIRALSRSAGGGGFRWAVEVALHLPGQLTLHDAGPGRGDSRRGGSVMPQSGSRE